MFSWYTGIIFRWVTNRCKLVHKLLFGQFTPKNQIRHFFNVCRPNPVPPGGCFLYQITSHNDRKGEKVKLYVQCLNFRELLDLDITMLDLLFNLQLVVPDHLQIGS